jgi:hypothetical protein
MNKLTIYLLTAIAMIACSSEKNTAQNKVEDYIKANADDPKSYEFINVDKPDTVRISDTLNTKMYLDSVIDLSMSMTSLKLSTEYLNEYEGKIYGEFGYIYRESYEKYKAEVEQYTLAVKKAEKTISETKKKIQILEKTPSENKILRIRYKVNFRLKNGFGAMVKSSATVTYLPLEQKWEEVQISK